MTLTVGYLVYATAKLLVHIDVATDLKLKKRSTLTKFFFSESLTAVWRDKKGCWAKLDAVRGVIQLFCSMVM